MNTTWKRAGDSDQRIIPVAAAADRFPTSRSQLAPQSQSQSPPLTPEASLLPWRLPASVRRHRPQRRS